jgi:hypothetical protein
VDLIPLVIGEHGKPLEGVSRATGQSPAIPRA